MNSKMLYAFKTSMNKSSDICFFSRFRFSCVSKLIYEYFLFYLIELLMADVNKSNALFYT